MTSLATGTAATDLSTARNHLQQGRFAEAEAACRQLLRESPNSAEAQHLLGLTLHQRGRPWEALEALQQALGLRPDSAEALCDRGKVQEELGWLGPAVDSFLWALFLKPDFPEAAHHLAGLYRSRGLLEDAEATLRALPYAPRHAALVAQLGNVLLAQGRQPEALALLQQARTLAPEDAALHSNLLLCEQYGSSVTPASLATAHAEWHERHAKPLRSLWKPFANVADPERPLRLGFVSAGFTRSAAGSFLVRVMEALAARECAAICYAAVKEPDEITARFTAAARSWRDTRPLSDEALTEQIRADGIDILFDLDGHLPGNRLLVFARKPAPLQITWLGYPGTTGLGAMDYLLADRFHIAPGSERFISEEILRMPNDYGCYEPPSAAPPVGPLPGAHDWLRDLR